MTDAAYDHRTALVLNLLRSNTEQALGTVKSLVRYQRLPPARDRVYSARDILDRVWGRDAPTPFERKTATTVLPRPHGRPGWTAPAHPRLDEIRRGRTVAQMLARGVTEQDIRAAVRAGWLVLS